jgi:hypothetical protein
MVRRKRKRGRSEDWHHRVPDFKLVYCGPTKSPTEESKHVTRERKVTISMATERDNTNAQLERPKKKKTIKQMH